MAKYLVHIVMLTGTILQAARVEAKKTDIISDAARDEMEDIFLEQWAEKEPMLLQMIQAGIQEAEDLNGACLMENSNTFYDPIIGDCRHCSTCRGRSCYNKCYSYELQKRMDNQESGQMIWSTINSVGLVVNLILLVICAVYFFLEQRRMRKVQESNKIQSPVADSEDHLLHYQQA